MKTLRELINKLEEVAQEHGDDVRPVVRGEWGGELYPVSTDWIINVAGTKTLVLFDSPNVLSADLVGFLGTIEKPGEWLN